MFEKAKQFVKDHKYEIIAGATIATAGVVVGMVINGKLNKDLIDLGKRVEGKSVLTWFDSPETGFMNLDTVKNILDLNADNNSRFAIFRDGLHNADDYVCILSTEGFVFPEVA